MFVDILLAFISLELLVIIYLFYPVLHSEIAKEVEVQFAKAEELIQVKIDELEEETKKANEPQRKFINCPICNRKLDTKLIARKDGLYGCELCSAGK